MQDVVTHTLASSVAQTGTFNIAYPAGRGAGSYSKAYAHKMYALGSEYLSPTNFSLAFGAANITVTWNAATTLPSGSTLRFNLDRIGSSNPDATPNTDNMNRMSAFQIDLGCPAAAAANAICLSQAVNSGVAAVLNGATAGVLDVPRAVVAAWTTTAICTIRGLDAFGQAITETSPSGAAHTGKKAFKSITSITFNANVTACTVGTGDVLGLPVFLPNSVFVIKELEDNALATAGALVVGDAAAPSGTTGDVRGTYDPNSACNGQKNFQILTLVPDPSQKGLPQYAA